MTQKYTSHTKIKGLKIKLMIFCAATIPKGEYPNVCILREYI